jgi:hypothetical protein
MTTSNHWTPKQLSDQSHQRANGYCPGSMAERPGLQNNSATWNTNRLIHFGVALAKGYGMGL